MNKKADRAKNPFGGEVAITEFKLPDDVVDKMKLEDNDYALIGKIFVHWGQIEADTTSSLFLMMGLNGNEDAAASLDDLPLMRRIEKLRSAFLEQDCEEPLDQLEELSKIIDTEKWKRDVLAHGALLFSHEGNPSFYLQSRKTELNFDALVSLEPRSASGRELARRIYSWCLRQRADRRGTPLQWIIAGFSTSKTVRINVR
jgi:hypothetical protein